MLLLIFTQAQTAGMQTHRAQRTHHTVLGLSGWSQCVRWVPRRRPEATVSGESPAALHLSPSKRWGWMLGRVKGRLETQRVPDPSTDWQSWLKATVNSSESLTEWSWSLRRPAATVWWEESPATASTSSKNVAKTHKVFAWQRPAQEWQHFFKITAERREDALRGIQQPLRVALRVFCRCRIPSRSHSDAHEKSTSSWMKPSVSSVGPDVRTPGAHFHGTGQPERRRGWVGRGEGAAECASLSEARHAGAGWERGGELPTCGRLWRTELRWEHDLEDIRFCCAQEGSGRFPHSATLKLYKHNPQGLACLFDKWNPKFKKQMLCI